jgi:hypothetical protein
MNTKDLLQALNMQGVTQELDDIAFQMREIIYQYERGELNESEFKELMRDIQLNESIAESSAELQQKAYFHQVITAVITAGSILV